MIDHQCYAHPKHKELGCQIQALKNDETRYRFVSNEKCAPLFVSSSHWCLAVAHARERRLHMGGQGRRCPGGDAGVDVANWEVVPTQVWGPRRCGAHAGELLASQQDNCDDCGVFTCIFSNYVSAALPFVFTAATSVSASPSAH